MRQASRLHVATADGELAARVTCSLMLQEGGSLSAELIIILNFFDVVQYIKTNVRSIELLDIKVSIEFF